MLRPYLIALALALASGLPLDAQCYPRATASGGVTITVADSATGQIVATRATAHTARTTADSLALLTGRTYLVRDQSTVRVSRVGACAVSRVDTVRVTDTLWRDPVPPPPPPPVPPPPVPPPPPPAPEPEQPPPSGAGLVFASDWSTALGATNAALTDGGKWTAHNAYTAGWASVVARNAAGVPTAGNAPTRGNVLRVHYNRGGDLAIPNGIPTVAVGSSYYIGFRVSVDIRNAVGNLSSSPHHPVQPLQGSCAHEWSFKIGPRGDGTYELIFATSAGYPNNGWYRGTIPKARWDGWGLKLTRVAANSYRVAIQRNGADDGANWVRYDGRASDNLAALNPTFPISDACARHLFLGNNGPGWPTLDPTQDLIHWAEVEVRTDRWPQ